MDFIRQLTFQMNDFFVCYLAFVGICFVCSFLFKIVFLYRYESKKKYPILLHHEEALPISLLVATWNAESSILETIASLLHLHYPLYEIIVIDDGSTDLTVERIVERYQLRETKKVFRRKFPVQRIRTIYEAMVENVHLTLVVKDHGGRADSLNAGINVSSYPYFVTVDSTFIIDSDALMHLVLPVLENPNYVAVGGSVRISEMMWFENGKVISCCTPRKMTSLIQYLEYYRVRHSSKLFLDHYNGNLLLSGSFVLFQKEMFIRCGGYQVGAVGEEMEVLMHLHEYCLKNKIEYQISSVPEAICYIPSIGNQQELKQKQIEWQRGLFHSLLCHLSMSLNPKYGLIGFVYFFHYWILEFFVPLVELAGVFFLFLSLFMGESFWTVLSIYLLYSLILTIGFLVPYFTRLGEKNEKVSYKGEGTVILYTLIGMFGTRPFLNLEKLKILFADCLFAPNKSLPVPGQKETRKT